MSPADFHKITSAMLVFWSVLGVAFAIFPKKLVRAATSSRVESPAKGILFFRVLGCINAFGVLQMLWFGR
jgi:hypothetical protein